MQIRYATIIQRKQNCVYRIYTSLTMHEINFCDPSISTALIMMKVNEIPFRTAEVNIEFSTDITIGTIPTAALRMRSIVLTAISCLCNPKSVHDDNGGERWDSDCALEQLSVKIVMSVCYLNLPETRPHFKCYQLGIEQSIYY